MAKKKQINEGLFSAAKRFSDAFFDSLKTGSVERVLTAARKARVEDEIIEKMEKIAKEKEELDKILSSIPTVKK